MNLLENNYKYLFVGGKGGVGKTTTSSSIAIQVAQQISPKKVLLISTDPAHNLSDAFGQEFGSEIQQIQGISNLFAIEINPAEKFQKFNQEEENQEKLFSTLKSMFSSMAQFPGADEIINFLQIMRLATSQEYETVVFDTAPTGHTLKFLEIPRTAIKLFNMLDEVKPLIQPILGLMGGQMGIDANGMNSMFTELASNLAICQQIKESFEDPIQTTFVCVAIPEFLSVYETERLIQHLARLDIDCGTVVVNQVLNVSPDCTCKLCMQRSKMQQKYLNQLQELYEDYDLIKMPTLENEVRGLQDLEKFGKMLVQGVKWEQ